MTHKRRFLLAVLGLGFAGVSAASPRPEGPRQWLPTWAASMQSPGSFLTDFGAGFENQTIRQIAHISIGGSALRIRLSNAFGERAVRFDSVYVGIQGEGSGLVPGSNRRVTFSGASAVTIPAGAAVVSDQILSGVTPSENLAVSMFTSGATGSPTVHLFANQLNFVTESGDAAADESGAAFTVPAFGCWYYLESIEVLAAPSIRGAVVALGDSLTDGLGSSIDANNRYPDFLARRFLSGPPGHVMSVINGGLTASRVLNDSPCFGVNAGARLDREVLARRGIRAVIYTQGTNDFGYPVIAAEDLGLPPECFEPAAEVSAEQVIEGYRQVIARVHAAGVRIFGGTLNPIKGSFEWSEETEVKRQALNDWIRTSGEFDGVIDFASAVADPADPEALAPEFDCGDHLHPNDDGYAAMANAVNLDLFR